MKTGRIEEDPASLPARRGRELEQFARRAYERRTGIQMKPLCMVHEGFEWMRASLDGWSFDGSTLPEIKCGDHRHRFNVSSPDATCREGSSGVDRAL